VTTLPAQLRSIAYKNRKKIFDLLFRATADTLLELGQDPKHHGIQLGITAILHTWTRELEFHPHIHCIVTAGGLAVEGSPRWIHISEDFLFPVHVLSKLFQGKLLAGLKKLYDSGDLIVPVRTQNMNPDAVFMKLKEQLYNLDWVVYCKEPFDGVENIFRYLGRYTHRVAISNSRLIHVDVDGIQFFTKNNNSIVLPPFEFIRRFLMHVLPYRFVKIRHYGLMASGSVNTQLQLARALLTAIHSDNENIDSKQPEITELSWEELLLYLTGIELHICPACGSTNVQRYRFKGFQNMPLDTS